MKYEIGDYVIEGHRGDWVVSERRISEGDKHKGEEYYSDQQYFGRLYQALYYLLNCKLGESDEVTVNELVELINNHCKEIKRLADLKDGI